MDLRWAAAWIAACGIGAGAPAFADAPAGARIVRVEPWLAGEEAGLRPGDRLLSVAPDDPAHGAPLAIRDPLDALAAETRWSRVGGVRLEVAGASGEPRTLRLAPDAWGLVVDVARETPRTAELAALEAGKDTAAFCRRTAEVAISLPAREGAWLHWRCARHAAAARDWTNARPALLATLPGTADDADVRASVLIIFGRLAITARQWDQLDLVLTNLPTVAASQADASLALQLRSLDAYGDTFRSRYAQGVEKFDAVLRDIAARYPGTLLEAYALTDQGFAFRQLERFDEAKRAYLRAAELYERQRPLSLGAGNVHLNLGMLRRAQGDITGARREVETAVAMFRKVAPGSRVANALNNLSMIHWDIGDFVTAESIQEESLSISKTLSPEGYDVAVSLQNLGAMALDRRDVALGAARLRRSQAILERVAPMSTSLAQGHHHLARVDEARDDFAAAARKYEQAIAIWRKISPGSLREAWSLHNLGGNANTQGRFEEAIRWLRASLAIRSKVAPGGMDEARGLNLLAAVEIRAGDLAGARAHLEASLATWVRIAPESEHHAIALHALGEIERAQARPQQALRRFCEADRVLDLQRRRVSVSRELQSEFAARRAEIPEDCAQARLEAGEAGAALDVIERSRARALRARLADFRVAFAALPQDLRNTQADLSARRSRIEATLAGAVQSDDGAEQDALTSELAQLEHAERAWLEALEARAPRVARELNPRVESHADLLARLPPDAAVLVYLVAEDGAHAWLLSGAERSLDVAKIPLDVANASKLSADLRERIVTRQPEAGLQPALRRAHDTLLGPFARRLEKVRRLLIVPDRGLQLVPFAALMDTQGRYLVETHDLALAPSISVAFEREAAMPGPDSLVGVALTSPRRLDVGAQSREFAAIPSAAGEVRAIAGDYPGPARLFIDAQAAEAQVRDAAAQASVLHIAAHGYFDPARPLDSGLLLAPAAAGATGDDGVLHAWEVMAQWRLEKTRLVVLSACDTGIGEELAGEGLVGLGRAFQYAGARGVVASLWPVADRSTATLMQHMHRALVQGERPAAALVLAQRALLRTTAADVTPVRGVGGLATRAAISTRHPFHWAAFEVLGQLP